MFFTCESVAVGVLLTALVMYIFGKEIRHALYARHDTIKLFHLD